MQFLSYIGRMGEADTTTDRDGERETEEKETDDSNSKDGDGSGKSEKKESSKSDKSNNGDDESKDKNSKKKDEKKEEPPKPPFYKRPVPMIILIVVVVGGGIAGLLYWLHARHYETTDDAFIEGHVIAVSPKISGIVQKVFIDDNYRVKVGQLLVEIDPRDYEAALLQAEGNYASMQGKLKEAEAQVPVSQANIGEANAELVVAQANAENAKEDLQRFLALDERARSKQQMDNATAANRSNEAQVQNAQARVAAAKAQLVDARMAVQTAQGNLKAADGGLSQARINLGYCKIRAESDGVITRKDVEPGMYIQVDQPMFSIVEYNVWVVANYKETQLPLMAAGQPVEITVDAYPGRKITGKVQSIQNGTGSRFTLLPPENATGNYVKIVQRIPVKIELDPHQNDDAEHLLSPGMSVDPAIKVR
jgi:membrane fusion protein (multidrug efflux system)